MCGQWRVVGGSEGVDSVWYTAAMVVVRASEVSWAAAEIATAARDFGGVWNDSGNGNGRRVRRPISGSADGGVRNCSGKGGGGRRKRARKVSGSEGGHVEIFGL